jgi:eukaryotic-like serine/threonine-protein kinase
MAGSGNSHGSLIAPQFAFGFWRRQMDSARWKRIRNLFDEAVEFAEPERLPYLQKAADGDAALVDEVLAMLEEDDRSSLLDKNVAQVAGELIDESAPEILNKEFGPYRVLRLIGEGGMGLVYEAERTDLGSKVAIKVLRDAWLSPARRARFASEQHLLAQLTHPSIARLYDADTLPDGTPWFVMEYVDGVPLTEYCRSRACSIEERLRLLRSVCEAVQYAHAHAVIHRDLKPSNILVKSDGTARLLDFGIAKQMESLESPVNQTMTGLRLLTPAYAAPEQIRGEPVGVRTDVYSLGVILFELLSGEHPFDLKNLTPGEAATIVVGFDPGKPSGRMKKSNEAESNVRLSRSAWADLDILCLTAMHKDPARRYASVEALMRDIDNFLDGEPLEARPDSIRYRTEKFVRRNWRGLAATAAVFVVIVGLTVVFTWRLAKARNEALAEAARTQRIQEFMIDVFQGGDAAAGPAADLKVVDMLEGGVRQALALNSDPKVRAELVYNFASIYEKLGQLGKADTLMQLALEQRKQLYGADSAEVAQALSSLGMLRSDQSRLGEAEPLARQGLAMARRHLEPNDPIVMQATINLGRVLGQKGDYGEAIQLLEQAVQNESDSSMRAAEQAKTLSALADVNYNAGHYQACVPLYQHLLEMHRQLYGDRHPLVAEDLSNLGATMVDLGFYSKAEGYIRQALDVTRSYYGNDNPKVATTLTTLGRALEYENKFDEATAVLQQALTIEERTYGPVHSSVAETLNELGNVASMRGELDEAEARFRRVVEIYRSIYGDKHPFVAIALSNIGTVLLDRKDYAGAEAIYRDVVRRFTEELGSNNVNTGIAEIKLGRTLLREKQYKEAQQESLSGYEVLAKQTSPSSSFVRAARRDLAAEYEALKEPKDAAKFREETMMAAGAPSAAVEKH